MAYLRCPNCGLTMFDRNPLTSPRHCPRCARRNGASIELERTSRVGGCRRRIAARRDFTHGKPALIRDEYRVLRSMPRLA